MRSYPHGEEMLVNTPCRWRTPIRHAPPFSFGERAIGGQLRPRNTGSRLFFWGAVNSLSQIIGKKPIAGFNWVSTFNKTLHKIARGPSLVRSFVRSFVRSGAMFDEACNQAVARKLTSMFRSEKPLNSVKIFFIVITSLMQPFNAA